MYSRASLSSCLTIVLVLLLGCVHEPAANPNGVNGPSETEYLSTIAKNTVKTNQYAGFYQTFQADLTILTADVETAGLRKRGYFLQWDPKQYQAEREKMLQDHSAYSKFFMRFFSPDHDYDDLQKGKSIWRVYIEISGQRFEGKVKKLSDKYVELQTLYPYLDHFSTPYEITFNVPMHTVENGPAKVTLTSSLGTAEFIFPLKK